MFLLMRASHPKFQMLVSEDYSAVLMILLHLQGWLQMIPSLILSTILTHFEKLLLYSKIDSLKVSNLSIISQMVKIIFSKACGKKENFWSGLSQIIFG